VECTTLRGEVQGLRRASDVFESETRALSADLSATKDSMHRHNSSMREELNRLHNINAGLSPRSSESSQQAGSQW
jgi:hypothetical protein